MFDLENILKFSSDNIQIIGIFIAIIGGLVATKLLNAKIEKDTLIEKLTRINKEIEFNNNKKSNKEKKIYLKKKEDYMYYIYDKILEDEFDINDYEDYGLTKEQRLEIIEEIKELIKKALEIFKEKHKKSDVEYILKQNHIQENTIEHTIYDYVGYETGDYTNSSGIFGAPIPNLADIRIFAIIIPQIILSIYPLFINFKWLKYIFSIYSIMTFVISMIVMLWYIYKLLKNIKE